MNLILFNHHLVSGINTSMASALPWKSLFETVTLAPPLTISAIAADCGESIVTQGSIVFAPVINTPESSLQPPKLLTVCAAR